MKTITIRGVDSVLADKLKKTAKRKTRSVNQFMLDMLKKNLGLEKEKKFTEVYHDLDHLFGKWSKEEFDAIQSKIDSERKIDKELWE
jgi:plasmid stability protein